MSVWVPFDVMFSGKNIRGSPRALDTRLLIFGSMNKIESSCCRWDYCYELWIENTDVHEACTKSSFDYKDKQDPSLVYDVSKTHSLIHMRGNTFMAQYFMCICFLYEGFLDKTLNVKQKVFRIWFVKSYFTIWKSWLEQSKSYHTKENFIDNKTFNNLMLTCDGFILYLITCMRNVVDFVPQYFSSDQNELSFAFVRTGQYSGRRTAVSHVSVIEGLMRLNKSREMIEPDDVNQSKKAVPIAHTRRRTVIGDVPGDQFIDLHGSQITPEDLYETMQEATGFACHLVDKLPGVVCPLICDKDYQIDSVLVYDMVIAEYYLKRSTNLLSSAISKDYVDLPQQCGSSSLGETDVIYNGKLMNWDTALAIAGNGGKTRRPAASRASRFFGYVHKPIQMMKSCGCKHSIKVGDKGNFPKFKRKPRKKKDINKNTEDSDEPGHEAAPVSVTLEYVTGIIRFISFKRTKAGLNYPTKQWCPHILLEGSSKQNNKEIHLLNVCSLWVELKNRTVVRCTKRVS